VASDQLKRQCLGDLAQWQGKRAQGLDFEGAALYLSQSKGAREDSLRGTFPRSSRRGGANGEKGAAILKNAVERGRHETGDRVKGRGGTPKVTSTNLGRKLPPTRAGRMQLDKNRSGDAKHLTPFHPLTVQKQRTGGGATPKPNEFDKRGVKIREGRGKRLGDLSLEKARIGGNLFIQPQYSRGV